MTEGRIVRGLYDLFPRLECAMNAQVEIVNTVSTAIATLYGG